MSKSCNVDSHEGFKNICQDKMPSIRDKFFLNACIHMTCDLGVICRIPVTFLNQPIRTSGSYIPAWLTRCNLMTLRPSRPQFAHSFILKLSLISTYFADRQIKEENKNSFVKLVVGLKQFRVQSSIMFF